jgi:DNA anti-recombination protein RmuC
MKTGTLIMCLVCMLLTGCNDKTKVKSDTANGAEIEESEMEVEPVLNEYEFDEARRLGESYLKSAKDLYSKGYVKQAAEMLEKLRKYLEYLTAKDLEDLKALMDRIQTPVAKTQEKAPEQGKTAKKDLDDLQALMDKIQTPVAKTPEKAPEQGETAIEEEIDQDKERQEELDTVVDLLITLNANIECLTCLATEIRDCLQSIEASQYIVDYHQANTKTNRLNSTILTEVINKYGRI